MNLVPRINRWWPLLVIAAYLGAATLFAQAPAWWTTRNILLSGPGVVTNDFSLVNQGQVKWLATQAAAEFDEKLQALGGAGSNITALVASFTNANNYLPINAGQLKNVVAPFYDRLLALDLTNCYPQGAGTPYPWSGATGPVNDYALVNAGQAKYVFSFDLEGVDITSETDTDNDGLPDWWEVQCFGNRTAAAPTDDPDEDGWDNLMEFQKNTLPFLADTDSDGIPDNLDAKPLNPEQDNPIVFVVDGDGGGTNVVIQDHKQYKIPQGTAKIALTLVVFSREWPYYTGEQSQFNDVVTYSIMGSAGTLAQGSYMVNDLHDDFADGEYPGGNWEAKDQEWMDVSALTANGDASIHIIASAKNINDNLLGSGVTVRIDVPKVDIVQSNAFALIEDLTNVFANLSSDSWTNVTWRIEPYLGVTGALFSVGATNVGTTNLVVGTNVWIWPGDIATNYTIIAYANELTNCLDTMQLRVLDVYPKAPTVYMFAGHTNDIVHLEVRPSNSDYVWSLVSGSPSVGAFAAPSNSLGQFLATTTGNTSFRLRCSGVEVWTKPLEVIPITPRSAWGGLSPELDKMTGMVAILKATVHHSSNTSTGTNEVQRIQKEHMGKFPYLWHENWGDVGYHFLQAQDGEIFEGRQLEGLSLAGGPYTKGVHVRQNNTAAGIGFCLLGDYQSTGEPAFTSARRLALEKALTALCRRHDLVATDISYHQAMALPAYPTECPGTNVIVQMPSVVSNVIENLK